MSFSKARIHRFNDDIPCAPPPGTYNPEVINKSVGPKINKCERFNEGKDIFLTASCESLNSLSDTDSCKTPFVAHFKTPKVPASASKFEMKKGSGFANRKASSTEFICKKSQSSSFEINSLKYSLNEVQEELALERNKTNNLLREVQKMKENYDQADQYSEALMTVLNEKTNLISVLEEKCTALENITTESFDSYHKYVVGVYSIFETYFKNWEKSETDFAQIFQKYENLISNYESYFQEITDFLSDLLHKGNSSDLFLQEPTTRSEGEIVQMLRESEKERKKYELVVQQMQKVISVLSDRVLESDQEVEKLSDSVASLDEENKKIVASVQEKDEEIAALRSLVNDIAMNFLNEVKTTEKDLLSLVDILKEKALVEKKTFEKQLIERNTLISKLRLEKSRKELQLQESLDLIETLKCKEETSEKIVEKLRSDCSDLKIMLEDVQQQLTNQRTFYDENYLDLSNELNVTFTKDPEVPQRLETLEEVNENSNRHVFVKHLFDLIAVMNSHDRVNNLYDVLQNDAIYENKEPISVEEAKEFEKFPPKVEWLQYMLNLVYNTFNKFNTESNILRNNYNRLRDDFVEKCDECAQLTQLLQVSEKRVESFEKQTAEQEARKLEFEEKISAQMAEIEALKNDKISLEESLNEQKFENKSNELMIESLNEDLSNLREKFNDTTCGDNERVTQLELSLKEIQTKIRTTEKENSRLNRLIGPYRQTLEKYEAETRFMSSKSDSDIVKKFSKLLDQQSTKLKMKQITKLRSDIVQLRKKNDELQTEINKYRKVAKKPGKENKLVPKNDRGEKITRVEIPVNATYVLSPKVNRV